MIVGDKVRVTLASSIRTNKSTEGTITDIKPVEEQYYNYEVEFPDNSIFWMCESEIMRSE